MSTDLEKYIAHSNSTKDVFDAWNEKQPATRKIMNRLPFTVVWPTIKFAEGIEKKPYINKSDPSKSGVTVFKKIKGTDSQGSEVSFKIQLPAVIAPRGFGESKTDSGLIKSLLIVFDLENPDHKVTCDNFDKCITLPACHEIMRAPGIFSMPEVSQFTLFDEATLNNPKYQMNMMLIKAKMAKVINLPKKDKNTYIEDSPLRTMFLNPLYYQDPEKMNEPPAEMFVSLKMTPGVPATPIKPSQFFQICEGKIFKDGKMIGQKRLGCECAPEIVFSKLNIGSKPSTKFTCTAVTVTRFQEAPKNDTQIEKQNYMDENGVMDEFTSKLNLEELLAGLSTGDIPMATATVQPGNSFNPMGIDSGLPEGGSTNTGGSLVDSLKQTHQTPQQVMQQQQQQSNQQSLNFQQGGASPQQFQHQSWQQQPVNPMQQQFGGAVMQQQQQPFNNVQVAPANTLSFQSFPPQVSQINNLPSLNMSNVGDRLSSFQPNMIPVNTSTGSI
jgi:hypothetical protein